MLKPARLLSGLVALAYLVFGLRFLFAPESGFEAIQFEPLSTLGLANIRALVGGSFAAIGFFLFMHSTVHKETGSLRLVILHLLFTLLGRITGLVLDGVDPSVLRNFIPVTVLLAASVSSLVLFLKSKAKQDA